jgi:hypothetical protein
MSMITKRRTGDYAVDTYGCAAEIVIQTDQLLGTMTQIYRQRLVRIHAVAIEPLEAQTVCGWTYFDTSFNPDMDWLGVNVYQRCRSCAESLGETSLNRRTGQADQRPGESFTRDEESLSNLTA